MEETDDLVGAGPRAGPYSDAYVDPSVLVLAMTGAVGRIVELRADHHTGPRVLPGSGDWLRLAGDRNEPRPPDRQPDDPVSLTTEVEGGVLVASVDDGKANALTFDLVDGLRAAVASAVGQGQPLLVTGRDGCFSAGFDLAVMNGDDQERAAALFAAGAILYREIIEAPVPVVASCTGHALAGGAILLLCADHRIGRSGPYKVGLNEVGIGMALPAFAVSAPPQPCGRWSARHTWSPRLSSTRCFSARVRVCVGRSAACRVFSIFPSTKP